MTKRQFKVTFYASTGRPVVLMFPGRNAAHVGDMARAWALAWGEKDADVTFHIEAA